MPLKIVFNPDGTLKSKWWYGVFEVDGRRKVHNLGVRIKGKLIPTSLKQEGDRVFEASRIRAQAKLEALIEEAHSKKSARGLVEKFYEMQTGEQIGVAKVSDIAAFWESMPRSRPPNARYMSQCKATLERFSAFIAERHPNAGKVIQVTHAMALAFMEEETQRKVSPKTWNDTLKLLRAAFQHLQPESGAFRNPFERIPTREAETVFRKPFNPEELKAIVDAARDDDFIRPILITGICTAMRRGDCCLLRWPDVDMAKRFITVKTAKTGVTVAIPIFAMLYDELSRHPHTSHGYVFPEAAAMYKENPDGITWRVRKVFAAAGFKDPLEPKPAAGAGEGESDEEEATPSEAPAIGGEIHVKREGRLRRASVRDFHSFRVTWVTLALTAGVPLELVQRVTGHKTTDVVLKHYFRPGRDAFRRALETAMPRLFMEPCRPPKALPPDSASGLRRDESPAGVVRDDEAVYQEPATPAPTIRVAIEALEKQTTRNWKAQRDQALRSLHSAAEWLESHILYENRAEFAKR